MKNKLDKIVGQEASNMKSQRHLEMTPSGIYQFRLVIPPRLQEIIGRKVVKKSLKTSDKKKAKLLSLDLEKYWQNIIYNAEEKHKAQNQSNTLDATANNGEVTTYVTVSGRVVKFIRRKISVLSDEQINAMAQEYLRTLVGYDEEFRQPSFEGVSRHISEIFVNGSNHELLQNAIAFSEKLDFFYDLILPFVESVCEIDFHYLDEDTKKKLTRECLKSYQKAGEVSAERNAGGSNYNLDTLAPKAVGYKSQGEAWDALLQGWKDHDINRPEKTVKSYQNSLQEFKKFVANKSINAITVNDVNDYKKQLTTDGKLEVKTITNKLSHLRAIFEIAKMNEKIPKNVFEGRTSLGKNVHIEKSRLSFTQAQIDNIFKSAIFINADSVNKWKTTTNRWLIAIAFATGARPEEIAQLRVEDLIEKDGLHFLNVSNIDSSGKLVGSIKNKSSIRKIPVHKSLIEAGLLNFFVSQSNKKAQYLFDDLVPDRYNRRYAKWGDWFNRYGKKHQLLSEKSSFYSFRDTFADMCRNSDISIPIMNAFMGHTNDNMSDRYGVGHSLTTLNQNMQKVKMLIAFNPPL